MIEALIDGKDAEIKSLKQSEQNLNDQLKQLNNIIRGENSNSTLMAYQDSIDKIMPSSPTIELRVIT
jgi:hypothetical protein